MNTRFRNTRHHHSLQPQPQPPLITTTHNQLLAVHPAIPVSVYVPECLIWSAALLILFTSQDTVPVVILGWLG